MLSFYFGRSDVAVWVLQAMCVMQSLFGKFALADSVLNKCDSSKYSPVSEKTLPLGWVDLIATDFFPFTIASSNTKNKE